MDSGYLVFFGSCAMMPFLFVGCGSAVKPTPLPSPVKMRIIYHEEHYLLGRNERATDGVGDYVFHNVSAEPVTIVLPPSRVLFLSDSGTKGCLFSGERVTARTELAERLWPEFLKQPVSFTLLPGEKRNFSSPFSMEIPNPARKSEMSANLQLIFERAHDKGEGVEQAFAGTITSESDWDDSRTTSGGRN